MCAESTATESEPEEEEGEEENSQVPPASIEVFKQKRRERDERIRRQQQELREQEARDRRRQKELEDSHGSGRKKKKKQRDLESDEDDSYSSVPRSEQYLHSQKHQRVSHHPNSLNMSGRGGKKKRAPSSAAGGRTSKRGKANSKRDEDYDDDTTANSTLASGSESSGSGKGGSGDNKEKRRNNCEFIIKHMMVKASEKRSVESDMDKNVFSKAKHQLFKKTKFTHGNKIKKGEPTTKLEADCEWLLHHMSTDEYKKFEEFPDLLDEYVVWWVKLHKDTVRVGLNKKHNEIRGCILDSFADIPDNAGEAKWNPDGLPETGKDMEDILFNRVFGSKVPKPDKEVSMRQLVAVTDILMPKVRKSGA